MRFLVHLSALLVLCVATAFAATADIKVENAWARAPAPGQKTAGAYLELKSPVNASLVAAASPLAERVEIHSMSMDGGVMRMRPMQRLELPAGKTVKLAPNGIHLMLVELKRPLKAGDKIPLSLTVQTAGAAPTTLKIEAEVRPLTSEGHHH